MLPKPSKAGEAAASDILMIVGSASQPRWKKGADSQLVAAVQSFKPLRSKPYRMSLPARRAVS